MIPSLFDPPTIEIGTRLRINDYRTGTVKREADKWGYVLLHMDTIPEKGYCGTWLNFPLDVVQEMAQAYTDNPVMKEMPDMPEWLWSK